MSLFLWLLVVDVLLDGLIVVNALRFVCSGRVGLNVGVCLGMCWGVSEGSFGKGLFM